MIEIFILVLAVRWIAKIARTRDASPWLFGTLAVLGFLAFPFVLAAALRWLLFEDTARPSAGTIAAEFLVRVSGWLWVGLVALYVSRVPGRKKIQPHGRWSCRGCGWLNDAASLKCDACGKPYSEP
jgi:hypothetical protein